MKYYRAEKWRRELTAMRNRGITLKTCAKELAEKYDLKEKTVKRAWKNRDEWMLEIFDLEYDDTDKLINQVVSEQKEIKEFLWRIVKDAESKHYNAKIGALKQLNVINKDIMEMLQSLGLMHKEPDKIDVKREIQEELEQNPEKGEKIKKMYQIEQSLKDE